jgi:hypothetical protein
MLGFELGAAGSPSAPGLKELFKHKLDSKAHACCLAYSPRGFVASNTHCLMIGTDVSGWHDGSCIGCANWFLLLCTFSNGLQEAVWQAVPTDTCVLRINNSCLAACSHWTTHQ